MTGFGRKLLFLTGYNSDAKSKATIPSDQKPKAEERIDALLLEGLDPGEPLQASGEFRFRVD